ncbi:MAG: GNAT family N-acetyltransferase [Candidatus Hodarchaeota archaeon]
MKEFKITGYRPGAIGRITELHAIYYNKHTGFGLFFESKVATEISEFLNRFNEGRDGFWLAIVDNKIVGSIAVDGINFKIEGAHLRWFIVSPKYQGSGIGNKLLDKAIEFCKKNKFKRVYLWTFSGLDIARYLYEKNGFVLGLEHEGNQWGVTVKEQMFELIL